MHLISTDLPGAVVADERGHLARADVEVDVGERLDGAEVLRDAAQAQERRPCRRSRARSLVARSMSASPAAAPGRGRGAARRQSGRQLMPAAVQALASVHRRRGRTTLTAPSLTRSSAMFSVVTQIGVVQTGRDVRRRSSSPSSCAFTSDVGGVCAGAEVQRERGRGLGLEVDRLVHRAALVALEDVLQPRRRRVLTGGRERLRRDLVLLQHRDHGVGVVVVRRDDRVDVRVGGELLLERRRRRRRSHVPAGSPTLMYDLSVELRLRARRCSPGRTASRCCRWGRRP